MLRYGNDEHPAEDTSDDAEANPIAAETLAWYDVNTQGVAHHPCLTALGVRSARVTQARLFFGAGPRRSPAAGDRLPSTESHPAEPSLTIICCCDLQDNTTHRSTPCTGRLRPHGYSIPRLPWAATQHPASSPTNVATSSSPSVPLPSVSGMSGCVFLVECC